MNQVQVITTEIKQFIRRRKVLLILCPVLVLALSITAAYKLPPEYKSSITMMVKQDETLNPMIRFNMAVTLASEDRLKSFNEIIYSRKTINMLIDTLDLADPDMTLAERIKFVDEVRNNVSTKLNASDSFTIDYYDEKPLRAKEAVSILANHFIGTKKILRSQRNKQTVDFFRKKMEELQSMVEQKEKLVGKQLKKDFEETPREQTSLQGELEKVNSELNTLRVTIGQQKKQLQMLKQVSRGGEPIQILYQLPMDKVDQGAKLSDLINIYRDYSKKYTRDFPELRKLESKIYEQVDIVISRLETSLNDLQAREVFLTDNIQTLKQNLERATLTDRQTQEKKLDLDVYRELYDEMKVKYEQARTTQQLGENVKNEFVVIDPPVLPYDPTKPNKKLLIAGGLFAGVFLGILAAALAELLDTTVRRPDDIQKFQKPIIAYLPEG